MGGNSVARGEIGGMSDFESSLGRSGEEGARGTFVVLLSSQRELY